MESNIQYAKCGESDESGKFDMTVCAQLRYIADSVAHQFKKNQASYYKTKTWIYQRHAHVAFTSVQICRQISDVTQLNVFANYTD